MKLSSVRGEVTRVEFSVPTGPFELVGKTTIPQACALVQRASFWCGLASGVGIVAAMQSTPTVMMWSDIDFPTPGTHHHGFKRAMQRCWLDETQLATYRTLAYGSSFTRPVTVVKEILEVMR